MHYPFTDIQVDFEINRPVRYQNTRKEIISTDDRRTEVAYNDNDNDNEIDIFRHHNGNNTNIKVIFKQVTMLDKCNCI